VADTSTSGFRLTPKWILGIVLGVVGLVFVFSNNGEATLRFLWFSMTAPGWVFLVVLLALGFASGWLIARSRYKA
jgi:drug/metabolite transporter (DMT)-like permease